MTQRLDRKFVLLLSFICALTIGNLYLVQPLLETIAADLHASAGRVGMIATFAQLGYGTGVLLIVPLGDLVERRKLMLWLLALVGLASVGAALSNSATVLTIVSFAIGFTTVVPQIVMPYAAALAEPARRASVLGTIQAGLLIGILLARTVAGLIAAVAGWRGVYLAATLLTFFVFVLIRWVFPKQEQTIQFSYRELVYSMYGLLKRHSKLRRISISGAMNFAVFSSFWTALTFLLDSSFKLGPATAGLFGLVGVAGALIAGVSGRIADIKGARFVQLTSLVVMLASFIIYGFAEHSMVLLIIGVVVMDAGAQANHISCQADIFSLDITAQGRLNGIYMFIRFVGGAIGSSVGAWSWHRYGWPGVVVSGLALCVLAFFPLIGIRGDRPVLQGIG